MKRIKDMLNFGIAGLIMTIIGYGADVLRYDILNWKAWWAYPLFIPLFWLIRYIVYDKFWRKNTTTQEKVNSQLQSKVEK